MAAKTLHDVTRAGLNALAVIIDSVTGLLTSQLGDVVTQKASSDEAEVYSPSGVIGIPSKPDAGKAAAEVVVIKGSGHDKVVGFRDARWAQIVTAVGLDYGETLVFSPAGGGYAVFRKDGSVQTFSEDLTASCILKNGEVDVFAPSVKLGDSAATPVALSSSVSAELAKIATSIGQCATYINGIVPDTVTPYVPGGVAATKVSAT